MKLTLNLDDTKIVKEVNKIICYEMQPNRIRSKVNIELYKKVSQVIKEQVSKAEIRKLIKEAIIEYIEKYQIRDVMRQVILDEVQRIKIKELYEKH